MRFHLDDDYTPQGARERRLYVARPKRSGKPRRPPEQETLRRRGPVKSGTRKLIERGLNGDTAGPMVARYIAYAARACDRRELAAAREMLYALERRQSPVLDCPFAAAGVVRVARFCRQFVRGPREADPVGDTPAAQLRSLAGHLLERWPVPYWLNSAWPWADEGTPAKDAWFVHLGAGRNLSTAPNLPYPLTRRMAHFATNAPPGLEAVQALRWGQCRGLEVPEELCREIVHTRLSSSLPDEPFWRTVVAWFALHPEVIGYAGVIADYLFAQRVGDFAVPPKPHLCMHGRDPDRLLKEVAAWHAELNRRQVEARQVPEHWRTCGIHGFAPAADSESPLLAAPPETPLPRVAAPAPAVEPPAWAIVEILGRDELALEGASLRHCAATYGLRAATGRSAIFSLRRPVAGVARPCVTIEVWPAERRIVQARAVQNTYPGEADRKLIEAWAKTAGLAVEPFVFGRS